MSHKAKGNKRERQCANAYAQAGYEVHRPTDAPYNAGDIFGCFDLFCIGDGTKPVHLVQVKANRAGNKSAWFEQARAYIREGVHVRMAECYDRDGWRVIDPAVDGYETVYDERERDCRMGEGLRDFLDIDSPA